MIRPVLASFWHTISGGRPGATIGFGIAVLLVLIGFALKGWDVVRRKFNRRS